MIDGPPRDYDEMFDLAGYYPAVCPTHPDHAVNRDEASGDMRCTSGHAVLPTVRDVEDRIGDALTKETT